MPKLGLTMETGAVGAWLVDEGDEVKAGQVIAEIVTEKITYDLETETAGTVLKILLDAEVEVPVGTPIVVIGAPGRRSGLGGAAPPPRCNAALGDRCDRRSEPHLMDVLAARARLAPQRVVLPESGEEDILRAARAARGPGDRASRCCSGTRILLRGGRRGARESIWPASRSSTSEDASSPSRAAE